MADRKALPELPGNIKLWAFRFDLYSILSPLSPPLLNSASWRMRQELVKEKIHAGHHQGVALFRMYIGIVSVTYYLPQDIR